MRKNTVTGFLLVALSLVTGFSALAQTPEQRDFIIRKTNVAKLLELSKGLDKEYRAQKYEAIKAAKINGWPIKFVDKVGGYNELMRLSNEGTPLYYQTHNLTAAITARVDRINTGGSAGLDLNGQSMIIGIWDGGPVRASHQDLIDRVTYKDGVSFFTHDEGTGHATHVAGTMMGSGEGNPLAKGLAYQAELWANDFNNDGTEASIQAAEGLLVSNHSYGLNIEMAPVWMKGAYTDDSLQWDNIMNFAPYYQAVFSAGNDRGTPQDTEGGRDLLTDKATTKNGVVVAAVKQVLNYTGPDDVEMTNFSSWGPTDDFRIKPDISTKGQDVFSTYSETTSSYMSLQGTSMASPGVAACLLLMQQHYGDLNGNFMRSATLRALMVNSADEAGNYDGPDYRFGWGLINAEKAVEIITNADETTGSSALIEELNLAQGASYTRTVSVEEGQSLKVTIAWTDPVSLSTVQTGPEDEDLDVPVLINDLDVRVTKGEEVYYPWKLNSNFLGGGAITGDNIVDNIESIEIPNAFGEYTITVTHKGTLDNGNQDYSLIASGLSENLGVQQNEIGMFNVYPNPTDDFINIDYKDMSSGQNGTVILYDLQGRIVKQFNILVNKVNVTSLTSGIYILSVEYEGYSQSKKIIIE